MNYIEPYVHIFLPELLQGVSYSELLRIREYLPFGQLQLLLSYNLSREST